MHNARFYVVHSSTVQQVCCLDIQHKLMFIYISHSADGFQRSNRLPSPSIITKPFCLQTEEAPSIPGTRLMDFDREACSAVLQTFYSWLNFTYALLIIVSVRGYLVAASGDEARLLKTNTSS